MIKLIAFDFDGTLTQHKTKLEAENHALLDRLRKKYRLVMVGAGGCERIFNQMDRYPIDIIGNYGLQTAEYDEELGDIRILRNEVFECDRESVDMRVAKFRKKHGFTEYSGGSVFLSDFGFIKIDDYKALSELLSNL